MAPVLLFHLRCLHRVLRARAPMMQASVCARASWRKLMKSREQVNNIASNYSPEVETEKPFTRKRKENDLWTERSCVYFDETAIVVSLIDKTAWFKNSCMLT